MRHQEFRNKELSYWDSIAEKWKKIHPNPLWRVHSDVVNRELLARWLPEGREKRLLKTDLFDEAFGSGLHSLLETKAEYIIGTDISFSIAQAARRHHSGLRAIEADVRCLPFADGRFDIVVSISTLDHFRSLDEVVASLRELHRVLRIGGQLVVTLDNPVNPVIALRNSLPFHLLERLRIVPYYVGATCGPRLLQRILQQVGLDVLEVGAVMHCPRIFAVAISRMLERFAPLGAHRQFLRILLAFEKLSRWPTRFLTGYFVAVRAVKRSGQLDGL